MILYESTGKETNGKYLVFYGSSFLKKYKM